MDTPTEHALTAERLSQIIDVPIYKLERLAALAMLDYHRSRTVFLWIRSDQLPRWRAAVKAFPGFRTRQESSAHR